MCFYSVVEREPEWFRNTDRGGGIEDREGECVREDRIILKCVLVSLLG